MWLVKPINKALSLLKNTKSDRFLVLEIFQDFNRAAYIKADFANKEIKIVTLRSHPNLKKLLKKFGRLTKYKIIVGLDSHLASTIYSSVTLVREHYKELIDEPELDNLISQAIWKFFDRSRNRVAGKLGVTDLDILLTDVRVRGIKLDGHKVVNPVGFKAKTVEIQFSQTFLSRAVIEELKDIMPLNQVVLMSENGTACSSVISKAKLNDNFLLVSMFNNKTTLFSTDGGFHSYFDQLNWGEENLKRSLADDLAVDREVAGAIIGLYIRNRTSQALRRRLEHLLMREVQNLARGLDSILKRVDTRSVYLNPYFELPHIFGSSFKNQLSRTVTLEQPAVDLISQNFGFDIKFKNDAAAKSIFCLLTLLFEWYLSPRDDRINQLAKRRVRWLSPL